MAWRRASRPARGGSGATELHAQCVEAKKSSGEAVPGATRLAGEEKPMAARWQCCVEVGDRASGGEWDQEGPGRLGGTPNGGVGCRWAGKPAAAAVCAAPTELEVEEDCGDLFVNCEEFRVLTVN